MSVSMRGKHQKSQTAIDFMVSYGVVILILAIALYVLVKLSLFNTSLAPVGCTAAPSFSCGSVALYANGTMILVFSQALGGPINVTGVACSSAAGSTGNLPAYGNAGVANYIVAPQYYPDNSLQYGKVIYSGTTAALTALCYNGGGLAKGTLGNTYIGSVWINYTYGSLPPGVHNVRQVVQFTAKYS